MFGPRDLDKHYFHHALEWHYIPLAFTVSSWYAYELSACSKELKLKITLMLWKITLLQSASTCWTIIGPTTQNPPLVRSCTCRTDVGPTTVL